MSPLEADPECAQFAKLIMRQSSQENFGFTHKQVRSILQTDKGRKLWNALNSKCLRDVKKFDFSMFCRELCEPEFGDTRRCFKFAKERYPGHDPKEVCFLQVWELCKRIEHVWTDLHTLA
jgi:hypothetical protein